jgi:hypothetical protein
MTVTKITPRNLVVTTRVVGPPNAPLPSGSYGTVLKVQNGRYLVLFGSVIPMELWLDADAIQRA